MYRLYRCLVGATPGGWWQACRASATGARAAAGRGRAGPVGGDFGLEIVRKSMDFRPFLAFSGAAERAPTSFATATSARRGPGEPGHCGALAAG